MAYMKVHVMYHMTSDMYIVHSTYHQGCILLQMQHKVDGEENARLGEKNSKLAENFLGN